MQSNCVIVLLLLIIFLPKRGFMKKIKIRNLVFAALGAAFISVCSWITIPGTVPFTLQTFAVFCVLCAFGAKVGTLAVITYIALGAVGLPVFSNFNSGIGAILGTTGGYIVGFVILALVYLIATVLFPKKLIVEIAAMLVGLIVLYAFGTAWFVVVYTNNNGAISVSKALSLCVVPFILPDLVKMGLAILISTRLRPFINKLHIS